MGLPTVRVGDIRPWFNRDAGDVDRRLLLIGLGLVAWAVWAASTSFLHQSKYILPNPIPGVPFFGNSFQMPLEGQGPFATKLAEKTGEMYTMKFGRATWVFLNSRRVVTELLDKRAAIYSCRQNLPMANKIISAHKRLLLMPYGAPWRKQRKAMHQILNNTKQTMFLPYQDVESRALLHHYMNQPERWWEANARFSNSVIMSVTYGVRSDLGDPDLANLVRNAEQFVPYLFPGQCLIDIFPWLLKAPISASWQPWRWWGTRLQHATRNAYKKLFDDILERRELGTQKPCFMTELLDSNKDDFEAEECYYICGTLIEAGSDTTRLTLNVALAAAVLQPDWVERTRKQLDEVCGANAERLPNFSDMDQLPLIKGVAKESLRWKPAIAETGIPHALTKDDEFEGYKLPAGAVVTYNHWAISHLDYEDPERFYPERFLDEDLNAPTKGHLGFGSGKLRDVLTRCGSKTDKLFPQAEECASATPLLGTTSSFP
ncbi:hypothetical protein AUP68_15241 [Ilyonectria robusta]